MGEMKSAPAAGLFVGLLSAFPGAAAEARARMETRFGPVSEAAGPFPWNWTDYYRGDMGEGLLRWFLLFAVPAEPGDLAAIKTWTNRLEAEVAASGRWGARRPVNVDPGLLTARKLVLASTKDFTHRVYLGGGVYAEVTLRWERGAYRPFAWTYRDYRSEECVEFLARCRKRLPS
jgi:hypothetical protein